MIDHSLSSLSEKNEWIIDSGASKHICNDKQMFLKLEDTKLPQVLRVGNGYSVQVKGIGTIKLNAEVHGSVKKCKLRKVLFVPDLKFNLMTYLNLSKWANRFNLRRASVM